MFSDAGRFELPQRMAPKAPCAVMPFPLGCASLNGRSAVRISINTRKTPQALLGLRCFSGAAGQIRTADLILTKDALYLLSYSSERTCPFFKGHVATKKGLEPSTSGVTGRRSNRLNYLATARLYYQIRRCLSTLFFSLALFFAGAGSSRSGKRAQAACASPCAAPSMS